MIGALTATWALFLGLALIVLGGGLQNTVLGVRASIEGFPTTATGLIMSGYYAGFLLGAALVPRIIGRVGHVRAFAALASLASTTVLVHVLFVDPSAWVVMRIVTGFGYAGLFIITESWLNDRATNETRGQLLSVYMLVTVMGMAGGQLLLNLADPGSFELFILVSVLVSLSLIPILLTATPAPSFEAPEKVSVPYLYKTSPLGVVGCFGTGMAHGALLGMGAVYAGSSGFSVFQISVFMGLVYLGGMILQWPIGRLSDRFDRRLVLTVVTLVAAVTALGAAISAGLQSPLVFSLACLFGGLCLPMYTLCVAHTNDYLEPRQMVAASASLYLVVGTGSVIGPLGVAALMSVIGPPGFFFFLAAIHLAIGSFALWRMARRPARPLDEQGSYPAMATGVSPVATVMAAEQSAEQQDESMEEETGEEPAPQPQREAEMDESSEETAPLSDEEAEQALSR